MNPQNKLALIGLLGVVIGSVLSIAGNFVLSYVTHSRERKQWIVDSKKAEWRELISTLTRSARCFADTLPVVGAYVPQVTTAEQKQRIFEADTEARRTIQDRIFIAKWTRQENILERWSSLAEKEDAVAFWDEWEKLHQTLLNSAYQDLGMRQ
jgi:K+-sensing histidine kinase KdpD